MKTNDRTKHAGPEARSATYVSPWTLPETPLQDAEELTGVMHQNIAESSTLLIGPPESYQADASFVTEWWMPCDEATAG